MTGEDFVCFLAQENLDNINEKLVRKGIESYKNDEIDAKGYVCDVTDAIAVSQLIKKSKKI